MIRSGKGSGWDRERPIIDVLRGNDEVRGDPAVSVLIRVRIEACGVSVEERQKVSLGCYACHDRPP